MVLRLLGDGLTTASSVFKNIPDCCLFGIFSDLIHFQQYQDMPVIVSENEGLFIKMSAILKNECNTLVKPLKLKLKVCISITFELFLVKFSLVVYRGKIRKQYVTLQKPTDLTLGEPSCDFYSEISQHLLHR